MPIHSSIQSVESQSLLLARYSTARRVKPEEVSKAAGEGEQPSRVEAKFEASYAALGIRVSEGEQGRSASIDSVQIDLSVNMTIDDANKILKDRLADKINETFKKAGVDVDIREIERQNLDTSPEATARRIVDFATGFLGVYAKNHADQDEVGRLEGFMSLIHDAIDQGFSDARDILKGIADISGPISDNIDKTHDLTQKGLDDFRKKQLDLISKQQEENPAQPAATSLAAA